MTEKINLTATTRTILGKKVKRSRQRGLVPAVVYGHGMDSTPIFVNSREYKKVYQQAGTSTLVDLAIDDKSPIKVLFHTPQYHHIHNEAIHADMFAVNMSEKIETSIPIAFVGESAAVKEMEGNFITNKTEINIKCLPSDLISEVEVDVSVLDGFDKQIHISDIKVPDTIEITDDPEDVVALVTAPRSEEELEAELADDTTAEEDAMEELAGKDEEAEEKDEESGDKAEESKDDKPGEEKTSTDDKPKEKSE